MIPINKKIILGVTGSISAYKTAELIRLLRKEQFFVQVVMTKAAKEFISPLTLQALSGNPVLENIWDTKEGNGMEHINLSRTAQLILIAPASANFIAKLTHGIADDLLSNLCLARKCPLLIAPAMNIEMWENPATQRNIVTLKQDGVVFIGPEHGEQACGEIGFGRLVNLDTITLEALKFSTNQSFKGIKILISLGATIENIDPARAITNMSSGKMGVSLAKAAYILGADVTIVAGKTTEPIPDGIHTVHAQNHIEMFAAINKNIDNQDIYISAAAISDYLPFVNNKKIKKTETTISVTLKKSEDILKAVASKGNIFTVGFAAESEDLIENAKEKILSKNIDLIIANLIHESMNQSMAKVTMINKNFEILDLPKSEKKEVAFKIMEQIHKTYSKEVLNEHNS